MRFFRLILLHLLALAARLFVRRCQQPVQRILYIKPDHLGDVLLATPVLTALRAAFPQAQITALVGPWSRMVLAHNPDIDTLVTCPFPGFERTVQTQPFVRRWLGKLAPYGLLFRFAALLRAGNYDLALVGRDDHWWGAALVMLAGIPRRVGFAVPECAPFLSSQLPWNPHTHVTEQGFMLVAACQSPQASSALSPQQFRALPSRFIPAPADEAWAENWHARHGIGQRVVVIHPGTGGAAKHWLDEYWSNVADQLVKGGSMVVLTGGPGEEARVGRVAAAMEQAAVNLAGQTSFGQLAALMARASLVLGVDSGPLHLAAAVGVPTIHLYGPGNEQRFGPWGDPAQHVVLHAELWCRPCGVLSACPRGLATPECMERITVQQVVGIARRMLV